MAIGGPGDQQETVNAGAASQPLVTSADPNVTGPAAVQNLVDSFRNGSITMNDIIDRVGTVAQAKNKAVLQQLGEYVSPDAINARHQAILASGNQAGLSSAQARSSMALLPGQEEAAQAALDRSKYSPEDQEAIAAYGRFNPIDKVKGADGKMHYDYDSVIPHGYDYKGAFAKLEYANKGLQVTQRIPGFDPKTNAPTVTLIDGFGQQMTKERIKQFTDMQNEAFSDAYDIRMKKHEDGPANPAPTRAAPPSLVTPAAPASSGLPVVTPAAPAAAPAATTTVQPNGAVTVQPAASSPTPQDIAMQSTIQTGMAPGTAPNEVAKTIREGSTYTDWSSNIKSINEFSRAKTRYEKPGGEKNPQNDVDLANSVMNLTLKATGGGARTAAGEYRVGNIEEVAPVLERFGLKGFLPTILKQHAFPPQVRDRLKEIGDSAVEDIENTAAKDIAGIHPDLLKPTEKELLAKRPQGGAAAPAAASAPAAAASSPSAAAPAWAPPGTTLRTVGGKPAWVAPNGNYWPQ